MNVFELQRRLIGDYASYVKSFISIRDPRIRGRVDHDLDEGLLWPEPRIGLNPSFAEGGWVDELVEQGLLHPECGRVFRLKSKEGDSRGLRLHKHQREAIEAARSARNYVLTTGTGSGKSLAYIIPIVDHVLRQERRPGIKAVVVYPMNALANSQHQELEKFLCFGYPDQRGPVTFRRYTGQETDDEKRAIIANPPDILLTNYVMLELVLTRADERPLVAAAKGLQFLVLDELHTYRGRQGADVALLVRRTREACEAPALRCIGTSATMGSAGTLDEQRAEVARVASLIFGAPVEGSGVIGETLRRATPEPDLDSAAFSETLADRVDAQEEVPGDHEAFLTDPLSAWVESTFGIRRDQESGRLVRVRPRSIAGPDGAARDLAERTGADERRCIDRIQLQLLAGSRILQPDTGLPVFAFRLHQFLSRGDTVYASLEAEETRHITAQAQQFVPGDHSRSRVLVPVVFCRECGQEYYSVRLLDSGGDKQVVARRPDDRGSDEEGKAGYLHISAANPWRPEAMDRYPEDWLEPDGLRLKKSAREHAPKRLDVHPDGRVGPGGLVAHFAPAPLRLCLCCGVAYRGHQRSDFAKLGTLGSEGRSTATTVLALSVIRHLRSDDALDPEARKLLSFTDNRQDASLQAGHFNDFVQVSLLRSGLYRAVQAAPEGLSHDELTQKVTAALGLEDKLHLWAANPGALFLAAQEARKALRNVVGYRLYLDQRRGWRITSPNLEQTALLRIEYASLSEICAHEVLWSGRHFALATASPDVREAVCRALLDLMRRELAIKVDFLEPDFQERMVQASNQHLREPWSLDESEQDRLETATILLPRGQREGDWGGWYFLSPRGGFGQYLRRPSVLPHMTGVDVAATGEIAAGLLEALAEAGLVQKVREPSPKAEHDVPGYQLLASAMRWHAGDGQSVPHDPVRVPRAPAEGSRPNAFFLDFYRTVAGEGHGLEAREHTAQVPYEARQDRETRFRAGELPILFCSPTMELGVDIAQLNVVSLRNVPPTPANYAQRSGRAGRGGQPALVFTYCSTGSPHDQYFFRRPEAMVSGQVAPPRLDLVNEDLIRAHVHAVWLAETGLSLGKSLGDILDLGGDKPSLAVKPSVRQDLGSPGPRKSALARAGRVLAGIEKEAAAAGWWSPRWLDDVIAQTEHEFEAACGRWRSLYRAALTQAEVQQKVILDHARDESDRREARRLRAEAEAQLALLRADGTATQSDFYSYRYFASEAFLPGYSFPRLPLSAFIPGRRGARGTDEFLSRPRFLAIGEFGPRNWVYHEGSRYQINRVILPVGDWQDTDSDRAPITSAKRCPSCGYLHPLAGGQGPDRCESCNELLAAPLTQLFRLQNVVTRRRDRISSDEEERQRLGYTFQSAIRFAEVGGQLLKQTAAVEKDGRVLMTLAYGHAATVRRINLGWRRRKPGTRPGFVLDMERGYWSNEGALDDVGSDEPMTARKERVIPFVEDRKNVLVVRPEGVLSAELMASLQAALKSAIQVESQLEDGELAAEPLPDADNRAYLLLYEAAEGGAGVLRRLVDDPAALPAVARAALEICHFDPATGEDRGRAPGAKEACEAACYDCLMSYTNQPDHRRLDRKLVRDLLLELASATVQAAPGPEPRASHLDRLSRLAGSDLERRWLDLLMRGGFRLPTDAQKLIPEAGTRPDFVYDLPNGRVAVYVDGPVHDFPDRQQRDAEKQDALLRKGWAVLRFRHDGDWEAQIRSEDWRWLFGPGQGGQG